MTSGTSVTSGTSSIGTPYCAKTQPKRNRLVGPNHNLEIHASAVAGRKRLDGVLCYYEPVT